MVLAETLSAFGLTGASSTVIEVIVTILAVGKGYELAQAWRDGKA